MLTEKGTVKASTPITPDVMREFGKSNKIFAVFAIVLGSLLVAIGIGLEVASAFNVNTGDDGYIILVLGAIFLACGIIIVLSHKKAANTVQTRMTVAEVEFCSDHMMAREYVNGEHTSTSKIYYAWVVRLKETPSYLFIYNTAATAIAVAKSQLTPAELFTVRGLLNKAVAQPQAVVQQLVAQQPAEPQTETQQQSGEEKSE